MEWRWSLLLTSAMAGQTSILWKREKTTATTTWKANLWHQTTTTIQSRGKPKKSGSKVNSLLWMTSCNDCMWLDCTSCFRTVTAWSLRTLIIYAGVRNERLVFQESSSVNIFWNLLWEDSLVFFIKSPFKNLLSSVSLASREHLPIIHEISLQSFVKRPHILLWEDPLTTSMIFPLKGRIFSLHWEGRLIFSEKPFQIFVGTFSRRSWIYLPKF